MLDTGRASSQSEWVRGFGHLYAISCHLAMTAMGIWARGHNYRDGISYVFEAGGQVLARGARNDDSSGSWAMSSDSARASRVRPILRFHSRVLSWSTPGGFMSLTLSSKHLTAFSYDIALQSFRCRCHVRHQVTALVARNGGETNPRSSQVYYYPRTSRPRSRCT
jgi:hypothetical protein